MADIKMEIPFIKSVRGLVNLKKGWSEMKEPIAGITTYLE